MKVDPPISTYLGRIEFEDKSLEKILKENARTLDLLTGRINNRCISVLITFTTIGARFIVPHQLGRIPEGYIPIYQDCAASFYADAVAFADWKTDAIYLQSNVATVHAKFLIF